MYEMMFDLETLDTKPSAVVLSVGAVFWETLWSETDGLVWEPVEKFYRVLDLQSQFSAQRTVSESTLMWWQRQSESARNAAFAPAREDVKRVFCDLRDLVASYGDPGANDPGITAFWASPATFDFPIWEDLAMTFNDFVPWTYRQKYDVRTVVREAGVSAQDHVYSGPPGEPHEPVHDCHRQIDLLTAARQKLARRVGSK